MQKESPGTPQGELAKTIDARFGSFTSFRDQFAKAALSVLGSGWVWLSVDDKRQLSIETYPNQDRPWMTGR